MPRRNSSVIATTCPMTSTDRVSRTTRRTVRGLVRLVHNIHGIHTRVGAPLSGGIPVRLGIGSRTARTVFHTGRSCVFHFYGPSALRVNRRVRTTDSTIATIFSNKRMCVPLTNLVGLRSRVSHLRGRTRGLAGRISHIRDGLGGRGFIDGTPRTMVSKRGRGKARCHRGLTTIRRHVTTLGRRLTWWRGQVRRRRPC